VLGNADLALILDPSSVALRAGVTMSVDDGAAHEGTEDAESGAAKGPEYLMVEAAGRQAAVLLADVLRIEHLKVSRIEYIGYRPVLNFEGQLLPVEDAGGVLATIHDNPEAELIVVVCRQGNRHIGVAVSQVLDVASGGDLFEAGTSNHADGITLLKNRVIGIVDLRAVPPLPAVENVSVEWDQMEEAIR
jgi:two-component system chemotaxis sensor kinase CheA